MPELTLPALDTTLLLIIAMGAFFAGLVDAVVGGGGLVQIPLLFSALPNTAPAVIYGTNKLASVVGTSSAAWQYARRIDIDWRLAWPAIVAAFIASWLGARSVALLPPDALRPLVLLLLIAVAIYTFAKKDFGSLQRETGLTTSSQRRIAIGAGALIGFYDGFFGPGTGSFLIFAFIRFLGMDFLRASAMAKLVNVATNLAAILFFAAHGSVLWLAAGLMAAANLSGAVVGSRLALKHGSGFVRKVFLFVVCVLILKLASDLI